MSLCVVIVTFNRAKELSVTLTAIYAQKSYIDQLVVINNASTDETSSLLDTKSVEWGSWLSVVESSENLGGAGGFSLGVEKALGFGCEWIWMSDDDAVPSENCFRNILAVASDRKNAYGSVALQKGNTEYLCWPLAYAALNRTINKLSEYDGCVTASMLTFLGMMVSSDVVKEIGVPNANYFISSDDAQYSNRVLAAGGRLISVPDSQLVHPVIPRYCVKVCGLEFRCLAIPPWRRYYDVRNRLWNARHSYGVSGCVITCANLVLKLVFSLLREPERRNQAVAYINGIFDGLFKYKKSGNVGTAILAGKKLY